MTDLLYFTMQTPTTIGPRRAPARPGGVLAW
jgi:hypothetical protein